MYVLNVLAFACISYRFTLILSLVIFQFVNFLYVRPYLSNTFRLILLYIIFTYIKIFITYNILSFIYYFSASSRGTATQELSDSLFKSPGEPRAQRIQNLTISRIAVRLWLKLRGPGLRHCRREFARRAGVFGNSVL